MSLIDDALGQMYVAFGHGAGSMRVSREAVRALRGRYRGILEREAEKHWEQEAVEVLERLRAVGRLAAQKAAERGDTIIRVDDFTRAAQSVEVTSQTEYCPPNGG